jgi:hypothetical protein
MKVMLSSRHFSTASLKQARRGSRRVEEKKLRRTAGEGLF